jgi:hypothetical protein
VETLPDELTGRYLTLHEVDDRPGGVDSDTLRALQRAHVERVPHATIDVARGPASGLALAEHEARVDGGRA